MKNNRKKEEKRLNNLFIFMLWLLLIALTSLTIFLIEYSKKNLIQSSFLVLKDVAIYGNSIITSSDISELAGLDIGKDCLYSFLPHIIEKRIKSQSRYIKDAEVKKDLLKSQLIVTVEERKAIAIVSKSRDAQKFKLVDIDGFILNELTDKEIGAFSYKNLPFIFEDSNKNISGESLDEEKYLTSVSSNLGLKVLSEVRSEASEILSKLSYIDARNPDDIVLHLRGGTNIKISGERFKEGLSDVRYMILSSEFRNIDNGINYIDARFPEAVYCGNN